jgi:hypothetical protein
MRQLTKKQGRRRTLYYRLEHCLDIPHHVLH